MYQSTSYAVVADTNENIFDGYYINSDNPKISFRTIEEDGKKLLLAVEYDYKTGTEQITNGYTNLEKIIKQIKDSIILSKIKMPKQTIDDIKLGEGKIVKVNNQKVGGYKSETGEIYTVKPVCTHLGCELYFNNNDKIWECQCHSSKFSYDGKSIEVPEIND